ncbi:efflux RND transporter periplasmic adaptor subunit [Gemmata sp. JC717]|uniref:efflux RND transporter periplasmic adaptor subunit n=1 Tax=Gemmata algarum TaxID=2975278 RepID=UPI0021BAC767|nr:efflux RND transporter periplasmic adaptor subunit [Gemmata algarum]MDY3554955.1 efflux RND transporter periplasmic adaptor subunit [Gemmata algarum]
MSNRIRFLAVAGTLALAGVGAGVAHTAGGKAPVAAPAPTPVTIPEPHVVRVTEVRAGLDGSGQTYTGVVRARYETDLAFRVGAKIVARHVEVGQRVAAGTVLFRLDPTDYRLALKAAEADLVAAEAEVVQATAEYDRLQRTHNIGAGSSSDLDKGRSALYGAGGRRDRAKELLTLARNRLAYCELTADSDGVVTALPAETGQVVAEGQVVARFARDGEREAVVSLPENRVNAARTARATITLWAAPGQPYPATLRELSPIADPVTRTYQARFTIDGTGPQIALGMTATVHLAPGGAAPGFVLPLSSLLRTGDRPAVWVVDRTTGGLTLTPVEVREYRHETVVLSGGVKPGQLVVTAGVQKLDVGLTVRPWEAGNP